VTDNTQLLKGLVPLIIICALCGFLLTQTNRCTRDRIEANRQHLALKIINDVLPLDYDNDLFNDVITINNESHFSDTVSIYRARFHDAPVGIVFMPVIGKGYKGRIELAVGLSRDGVITGVRVTRHQETEGQGDRIDQRKSDWILGFDGRSLTNTPTADWAVESDGGNFDQLSGATISPRGVINAVKKTLDFYAANKEQLYK